jgi:hypothetical protein
MNTYHHKGDVAARTISPEIAFLFTKLRIGVGGFSRSSHHPTDYELALAYLLEEFAGDVQFLQQC